MESFLLGCGTLVVATVLTLVVPGRAKGWLLAAGALGAAVGVGRAALSVLFGGPVLELAVVLGEPFGATRLVLDPLSAFFALLVAVPGLLAAWYNAGYFAPRARAGLPLKGVAFWLGILLLSMLAVVTLRNALVFLVAWELMSLSSFFLVACEHERDEVRAAALKYLVWMHVGVALLVAGVALLSLRAGSLDIDAMRASLAAAGAAGGPFVLLLGIGFAFKAGLVPLHSWLPHAHAAAPAPVSALLSGVMLKTGIYGILRLVQLGGPPDAAWAWAVIAISAVTTLYGIMHALAQTDIKRLLAYSSVENVGIVGLGLGLGLLGLANRLPALAVTGFAAALFHAANHALFKGLLFQAAGAVYRQTHERGLDRLGGLARRMPATTVLFLLGAVAIAALPPLNGFAGELLVYLGILDALAAPGLAGAIVLVFVFAALALAGALAVVTFTKCFGIVFLGTPRTPAAAEATEVPYGLLAPGAVLALCMLAAGFFPRQALELVLRPALELAGVGGLPEAVAARLATFAWFPAACGGLVALVLLALGARRLLLRGRARVAARTWDCGYRAGTPRIQYTGSSYVAPLAKLVAREDDNRKTIERPAGLFPGVSGLAITASDMVERRFVAPLVRGVERMLAGLTRYQGRTTQHYILYALLSIVLALVFMLV